jgi:hypothetical protein
LDKFQVEFQANQCVILLEVEPSQSYVTKVITLFEAIFVAQSFTDTLVIVGFLLSATQGKATKLYVVFVTLVSISLDDSSKPFKLIPSSVVSNQ